MVPVEDRIDSLPLGGSTSIWTFIFKSLHRNTDIPVKARQKQRQCQKDRRGEIVDETMLIWSRFSNETWKGLLLFWLLSLEKCLWHLIAIIASPCSGRGLWEHLEMLANLFFKKIQFFFCKKFIYFYMFWCADFENNFLKIKKILFWYILIKKTF
jgi:hypothetical protein